MPYNDLRFIFLTEPALRLTQRKLPTKRRTAYTPRIPLTSFKIPRYTFPIMEKIIENVVERKAIFSCFQKALDKFCVPIVEISINTQIQSVGFTNAHNDLVMHI